MSIRQRSTLLAPLLAMTPLLAVETTFGVQAHVVRPVRTFADAEHLDRKFGFGVGFQLPIDFGAGQVLRPRLDYFSLKRDSGGTRYDADSVILSADYNHYFEGGREGAYLIGGLGFHSTRRDITRTFTTGTASINPTSTGFTYNVGLGYAFNSNFGLELKFMGIDLPEVKFPGVHPDDNKFMGNSLVASVSFTF